MAKVKVLGASCTIVSTVKMDDIKKLEKFQPMALVMIDGESKEEVFRVAAASHGSISANGICFDAKDADGFAQVTISLPVDAADKSAYIKENFGMALLKTAKMEEFIVTSLSELAAKFTAIDENIEVIG